MHDLPTLSSPIITILKLYEHLVPFMTADIAPGSLKTKPDNLWEPNDNQITIDIQMATFKLHKKLNKQIFKFYI